MNSPRLFEDQNVIELEVTVCDVVVVQIGHSLRQLAKEESYLGGQEFAGFDELKKTAMFSLRENHYVSI